jgi:tRNA G18 (ribose-2'-O)-methylase SpoU
MRGYFGIGIEHIKSEVNLGTLWRSAYSLGAAFTFTIGRRYTPQCSDTCKSWRHLPHMDYLTIDNLAIPRDCRLVGIEITEGAIPLVSFQHPERCIYLLGAEDHGITESARKRCHEIVYIPSRICLNVSVAGSIVMYDRLAKVGDIDE